MHDFAGPREPPLDEQVSKARQTSDEIWHELDENEIVALGAPGPERWRLTTEIRPDVQRPRADVFAFVDNRSLGNP
jgi:hypothetical protein